MSLLAIEGGEVYAPEPLGSQTILVGGGRILHIGEIDLSLFEKSGIPVSRIDARGCVVAPGLIDVHQHLLGGSGEDGWGSETPEILPAEIVRGGITTVVGCLGTNTVTKTMEGLLGRAKSLRAEGLTAFIWSGGYDVPPKCLCGSVQRDMLLIEEVVGAGEIAIADRRSSAPSPQELARLVKSVQVAGTLTGKAGVTHFHVGEERGGLAILRQLLDEFRIEAQWLYPTHLERSETLMNEAIALSRRGVAVDLDTVEQDLAHWVRFFIDRGGDVALLTASSDAAISSPGSLLQQLRECILEHKIDLSLMLTLVTANPARILKLTTKGKITIGADGDIAILFRDSLELRDLIAGGRVLLEDGRVKQGARCMRESNRRVELYGEKA